MVKKVKKWIFRDKLDEGLGVGGKNSSFRRWEERGKNSNSLKKMFRLQ